MYVCRRPIWSLCLSTEYYDKSDGYWWSIKVNHTQIDTIEEAREVLEIAKKGRVEIT